MHTIYYTTDPTERSTAAIERSANEIDLEWPVESHLALAKHLQSARQTCSAIARRALGWILQTILNHFQERSSSNSWAATECSPSKIDFEVHVESHPLP